MVPVTIAVAPTVRDHTHCLCRASTIERFGSRRSLKELRVHADFELESPVEENTALQHFKAPRRECSSARSRWTTTLISRHMPLTHGLPPDSSYLRAHPPFAGLSRWRGHSWFRRRSTQRNNRCLPGSGVHHGDKNLEARDGFLADSRRSSRSARYASEGCSTSSLGVLLDTAFLSSIRTSSRIPDLDRAVVFTSPLMANGFEHGTTRRDRRGRAQEKGTDLHAERLSVHCRRSVQGHCLSA